MSRTREPCPDGNRTGFEKRVEDHHNGDEGRIAEIGERAQQSLRQTAPELRRYQTDVLDRIQAEMAVGRRRICVVAPTRSGKTVIAAALTARRGDHVVFVVHRRELTTQTSRKLHDVGVDHGILQAGFPPRPGAPVQIVSIQTLYARALRTSKIELPPTDLLIIDEAHHVLGGTYMRLIEAYPDAVILGLTATPCRGDGRGLGNIFDTLIECPSVADLTQAGHLVPVKIFAPVRPDLSGIRVERGDYVESQLAERMNTPALVGNIVENWCRLGEHRRTVVFTMNVAHSVCIRNEFRRYGVSAEHIYRETFGDWPRVRSVEPLVPDAATRAWVRERQIAFAKANNPRSAA